ncbi:hypothetical protein [Burkholderia cepacia]|uniref:hypothetical protein n=1 Tax=Burkholderia cepacia TaxID=292 RepID=UPI001E468688|nr:hypothetical protein [Burkholderia cepacia]
MKRSISILLAFAFCSSQAYACKVLEQDNMQLALNSIEIGNSDRLSLVRHFLTAREWTREGASATVDAAAFAWERNPKELAKLRGEAMKSFLVQLGMNPQDVWIHERIIQGKDGKRDPYDAHQVGVEFVPNARRKVVKIYAIPRVCEVLVAMQLRRLRRVPHMTLIVLRVLTSVSLQRLVSSRRRDGRRAPKTRRCSLGLVRSRLRTFATELPRARTTMSE